MILESFSCATLSILSRKGKFKHLSLFVRGAKNSFALRAELTVLRLDVPVLDLLGFLVYFLH